MSVSVEQYQKARQKYHDAAKAAVNGTQGGADAKVSKAAMAQECREMEREGARDGQVLVPILERNGRVRVEVQETTPKRELQGEYIRKFDEEVTVMIPDKPGGPQVEQTMRQYHSKRLRGR